MIPADVAKPYDVAVIGAGVFGAWTALHLARAGRRVLIADQHGPGNSRSSSGGETRVIRMSYGADQIYTCSAIRSLDLWRQFFPSFFRKTGVLMVSNAGSAYLANSREILSEARYPFEWIPHGALRDRFPQIRFDRNAAAVFEPVSGVLLARRAVQAVVDAAIQAGAFYETRRIGEPDSRLAATFVFACGPWLPRYFPAVIGARIRPTRQEVFFFGTPGADPRWLAMPVWIAFEEGVYTLPAIEGRGFKVAIDSHGLLFDPETGDRRISRAGAAQARAILKRRFPALAEAPLIESRVCQYENTPNGDFLIDRHPDLKNVWLVGGGSGHGFKHGPFVGEYVARQILAGGPAEPRFSLASKSVKRQRTVY